MKLQLLILSFLFSLQLSAQYDECYSRRISVGKKMPMLRLTFEADNMNDTVSYYFVVGIYAAQLEPKLERFKFKWDDTIYVNFEHQQFVFTSLLDKSTSVDDTDGLTKHVDPKYIRLTHRTMIPIDRDFIEYFRENELTSIEVKTPHYKNTWSKHSKAVKKQEIKYFLNEVDKKLI